MKYFATSALLVLAVAACTALVPPLSWEGWEGNAADERATVAPPVSAGWLARQSHGPVASSLAEAVAEPASDTSL